MDCLVVLGGNGSIKSANMLSQEGLNVIALPKTIDNDAWGTDYTFSPSCDNILAILIEPLPTSTTKQSNSSFL